MITIDAIIVDDQALIRSAVCSLLDGQPDISGVGEAKNGAEAIELAERTTPDVVVMDLRMPIMDGIEASHLLSGDPDRSGCLVLVLATFEEDQNVFCALRAGASGFAGMAPARGAARTGAGDRPARRARPLQRRDRRPADHQPVDREDPPESGHDQVGCVHDRAQLVIYAYKNRLLVPKP